ncbi:MAG TPA: hypothetical protein VFE04_00865, partial [Puia sp.]|nr:hypothetical protein [Puia sp.]
YISGMIDGFGEHVNFYILIIKFIHFKQTQSQFGMFSRVSDWHIHCRDIYNKNNQYPPYE